MDEETAMKTLEMPKVPVNFVPAKSGEILKLGHITMRIMEDGSQTDNRLGSAEFILPPHTEGPPAHWHEMHDEGFLVTAGTVRFHLPDNKHVDASAGDYVVVPIRAPHTFSNPFDGESRFFNTYTPAFYINYFKIMAEMSKEDGQMSAAKNLAAMAAFATLPAKQMWEKK